MAEIRKAFALGWQLHRAGDIPGAERAYRQALAAEPDYAEGWYLLGRACQTLGKLDEAVASHREAARLMPALVEAHNNLGLALGELGRLDEAAACYLEALRRQPGFMEAHNNLGNVFESQGRYAEAELSYREALRLEPGFAEGYSNLGLVLKAQKKWDEAAACYQEALRLKPGFAEAYTHLGLVYTDQGKCAEAVACHQQALRLKPDFAEAYNNLALALADLGKPDEAVACYEQALRLKTENPQGLLNLGTVLSGLGKPNDALERFDQALGLKPDYPDARFNRALAWLQMGQFEQGWPEYEWRLRSSKVTLPVPCQTPWDGTPLAGRTIHLLAEQGLGDTLQFVRYAPLVKQRGGTVVLVCQRPLVRLLAGCPGIDRVIAHDDPQPPSDVQVPLLSLPGLFNTTLANIPAAVPYLAADPKDAAHRRRELAAFPGVKVGIVWQGNPDYGRDRQRSIPLDCFAPLAHLPGVHLFSLQRGPGREQQQSVAIRWPLVDLMDVQEQRGGDFLDTAAIVANLNLVIACDTAVVHLAGALGVPAWAALPLAADWRWLLKRSDTPWYPTVRLFRQTNPGDWADVFERIAQALREPLEPASPVCPGTIDSDSERHRLVHDSAV